MNIYDLVRRDLIDREQQDIKSLGAPRGPYVGSEALLDAYESALDQACHLRALIEEMTIGDGSLDRQPRLKPSMARTLGDDKECPV